MPKTVRYQNLYDNTPGIEQIVEEADELLKKWDIKKKDGLHNGALYSIATAPEENGRIVGVGKLLFNPTPDYLRDLRVRPPTNSERVAILGGVAVEPEYRGKHINNPTLMEEFVRRRLNAAFNDYNMDLVFTNARPSSAKTYLNHPQFMPLHHIQYTNPDGTPRTNTVFVGVNPAANQFKIETVPAQEYAA